tara:strand:- start:2681 stop:3316 length:636 start_codon:yes stop_codon:yes gene_type:complete
MSFRIEEKLQVNSNKFIDLIKWLEENKGYTKYPQRVVSSIYFDNDTYSMFHDSMEGCVPRKKIRLRTYNTNKLLNNNLNLEIKISSVEGRFKKVKKLNNLELNKIIKKGFYDSQYGICKPKLKVTYLRNYYFVKNLRLTVDKKIKYSNYENYINRSFFITDPQISVEVKTNNINAIEYINQKFPFQKIRFSKYARGIESFKKYNEKFLLNV